MQVPEDRYILWEAEEQGLLLPWACRMGCCTACAVRVLEGSMHQPEVGLRVVLDSCIVRPSLSFTIWCYTVLMSQLPVR